MSVVQFDNGFKHYQIVDRQVQTLKNITVNIEEAVFLALASPSSSGKSTLLNMLGCIDSPLRGKILTKGAEMSAASGQHADF